MKKAFINLIFLLTFFGVIVLGIPTDLKAQTTGQCWRTDQNAPMSTGITYAQCQSLAKSGSPVTWKGGAQTAADPAAQAQVQDCSAYTPGSPEWRACDAQKNPNLYKAANGCDLTDVGCQILNYVAPSIGTFMLQITARITDVMGALLNGVINYTVVNVSDNYTHLKPLLSTWGTIRDLANMSFIFILLYAGILTLLGKGGDNKKLVTNVVIAAVLINFSLFFTRVIIDISNLFALTFYNAIAPNATGDWFNSGLSTSFGKYLGLSSLYKLAANTTISWTSILMIGIMGSALMLVAAFSFAAVAILFIIRYVVLIIVMILSPIMFLGAILPGKKLSEYRDQWWETLTGQAVFAPVYFLLTWVALRVMDGISGAIGLSPDAALSGIAVSNARDPGAIGMFINFAIVIVLIIAALVVAKNSASKGASGMKTITNWATGKAGNMVFGGMGAISRGTIGRAGQAIGENEWLKDKAASGGVVGRFAARQTLATGKGIGSASFDARNAPFGIAGKLKEAGAGNAGGKGGYSGYVKKKAEDKEKFAKTLLPSEAAIAKATDAVKNAKTAEEKKVAQEKLYKLKGFGSKDVDDAKKALDKEKKTKIEEHAAVVAEKEHADKMKEAEENIKDTEDKLLKAKRDDNMGEFSRLATELSSQKDAKVVLDGSVTRIAKEAAAARSAIEKDYENQKNKIVEVKATGELRKEAFASSIKDSRWAKIRGYNVAAANKIRGGKSSKDRAADILKDLAKDGVIPGGEEEKPEAKKEEEPKTETKPA